MTETQAQSGLTGTAASPVDAEAGAGKADGNRSVGRASVPTDAGSTSPASSAQRPGATAPAAPEPVGPSGSPAAPAAPANSGAGSDGGSRGSGPGAVASGGAADGTGRPGTSAVTAAGGSPWLGPGSPATGRTGQAAQQRPTQGSAAAATGRVSAPGTPPGRAPGASSTARTQAIRPTGMMPPPSTAGAPSVGARVSDAVRAARVAVSGTASRGPRRARLFIKRVDPWSIMKFSFAVSLVLFIVTIIATAVLYLALDAMGVFESVNKTLDNLVGGDSSGGSGLKITFKGVIGVSALLGMVNVVLFTALATLGAFVYNVCADLVGGIEVTLSEKE